MRPADIRPRPALAASAKRGQMIAVNSIGALFWLPKGLRAKIYRACGITVGRDTFLSAGLVIRPGSVVFGDGCFVNTQCLFDPGSSAIVIEDRVFIGARAILSAATHDIGPSEQRAGAHTSAPIRVGRGSWLGAGVKVLPGVTIARGCVIGAGSVVTEDTLPDTVYAGAPARMLRPLD